MPGTSAGPACSSSIRTARSAIRSSETIRRSFRRRQRSSLRRTPPAPECSLALLRESLADRVPVDDVPPRREVVGTAVLVLQVVGVLPHVDAEDRLLPFHHRIVLVRRALDDQLAAGIDQPRPAAAEAFDAGVVQLRLERVEAAEGGRDGLAERAARLAAFAGAHD